MTKLIYRGVKHDRHCTTTPRKPQKLIYRGTSHDGLSTAAIPVRHCQAEMCFRGIRYTLGVNGIAPGGAEALSIDRLALTVS